MTYSGSPTLHATPEFAEQHWDSPNETRGPLMIQAAMEWLGSNVSEYQCHRWGFAFPKEIFSNNYYMEILLNLTLVGDAFGGARIEGAALSGLEGADAIIRAGA